jgi:hypothetical protein
MIYSYQKHIDELRTVEIVLPVDGMQRLGTELATIDGTTYVHVPDSAVLPEQPIEIDVAPVSLTADLAEAIKAASPHVRLVNERIKAKIRERYDAEDEMYFARVSIGAITGQYTMEPGEAEKVTAYGAYVEEVRQWGRNQRAGFGL